MIKIKELNCKLGGKEIFKDFNLEIKPGEKILLNAASGKGKTTLFNILLGFQKAKGEIYIDDCRLNKHTILDIRKKISYVSQDIDFQNKNVKQLIMQILNYNLNKNKIFYEDIEKYLKEFNILDSLHKNVRELSGGERQRLGFAICMGLNREIWLLDEVTASLDMKMKKKVKEYILNTKATVLIISHDEIWDFKEVKW
ncbi:MAG: ATP-binding cassette domain-containing protein [Fusobacterium sp. JB021]|nr:ATP-binding cassette domain-containing protein [Fusobacterium sp. JB021]